MQTIAERWLTLVCQMLPAVECAAVISRPDSGQAQQCIAVYPASATVDAELFDAAALAQRRKVPTTSAATPAAVGSAALSVAPELLVAYPIATESPSIATSENWVLAVRLAAGAEHQAVVSKLLRWGVSWLQLLFDHDTHAGTGAAVAVPNNNRALEQSDFALFDRIFLENTNSKRTAELAASALKQRFSCDRVIIACGESNTLSIQAISEISQFDRRVNELREIESKLKACCEVAGAESLDPDISEPAQSVALPLLAQGDCIGAMLIQRDTAFDAKEIALLNQLAAVFAAQFVIQQQRNSLSAAQIKRRIRNYGIRLLGEGYLKTKVITAGVFAALLLLFVIPGSYRVSAPASMEGSIQRAVVAPFDGYIASAHRRAGDTVKMGEVLAELDRRQMALERSRWISERAELSKQYRKALAERDSAQAQILKSQIAQAEARLELASQNMDRAELLAPLDGIIIDGNLSASLGAPVERGEVLFEVAPLDEYRIVLEVSEREIRNIEVGQRGTLSLTALPGEKVPFVVERVASVFEQKDSEIVYRTEARVTSPVGFLRPGMKGTGKIDAGSRSYAYILFHDFFDWLRLQAWKILP